MIERTEDEGRLRPSSETPRVEAADRFEVLVGDHLHRLRLAVQKLGPVVAGQLAAFEVLDSAKRLEALVAEHREEIARPLGEKSAVLIERQGEMIRAKDETIRELRTGLDKLEKLEKKHGEVVAEYHAWRRRFEALTLKGESAAELAARKSAGGNGAAS